LARRGLLLALAVLADANQGRACGGDLEPDPPALLVARKDTVTPVSGSTAAAV